MADQDAARVTHKMAMKSIVMAAHILTPQAETLGRLVKADQDMHTTGPTLHLRAGSGAGLSPQVRLAKAAIAFVLVVQEIEAELKERRAERAAAATRRILQKNRDRPASAMNVPASDRLKGVSDG